MNGGRAVLGAADMDLTMGEVDGIPTQRHQFDGAKAMPVGEQHHGGVPMPIAVVSGCLHEFLNLGISEVFARPRFGI